MAEAELRDPTLRIEVDHAAYYQWLPVPEVLVVDDTPTETDDNGDPVPVEVPEHMVGLSNTIDSTFPGHRMYRATVQTATTSTTDVHLPDLRVWQDERAAAGLDRRSVKHLLAIHLADGPWPKLFPLDSITAIRCADPAWQRALTEFFLTDDELGGA